MYKIIIDNQEIYVKSLPAIYDRFSAEEIGCGLQNLYNKKIATKPYFNKRRGVLIEKIKVQGRVR